MPDMAKPDIEKLLDGLTDPDEVSIEETPRPFVRKPLTKMNPPAPVVEVKRTPLKLVAPMSPFEDPTPVSAEMLESLGFKLAPPEDFLGAKDTTYFLDVANGTGRTVLVYDFKPNGNQGRPAAHVYYNANEKQISESLVCFAASATVGQLRQLIEFAGSISPQESRAVHNVKTVVDLIAEVKKNVSF